MLPGHQFAIDPTRLGVVLVVLAMTFLSGVLGGFFFGMTHALRHDRNRVGSQ